MPYIPLAYPPGVVRPATVYDAKGRWYDTQLVRWHDNVMKPWGGWELAEYYTLTPNSFTMSAAIRGMYAYQGNNGSTRQPILVTATHAVIWALIGEGHDLGGAGATGIITPAGFTNGAVNESVAAAPTGVRTEAQSWHLDNFGHVLLACAWSDGVIYFWDPTAAAADLVAVTNAPTGCLGVVVTPEGFVVALGASSNPRLVQWSDQDALTTWTPTTSNQAGDKELRTNGKILAGRRAKAETLIWTDLDLWAMQYIAGEFVYTFEQRGTGCGPISRRAMAVKDSMAIWMGREQFFMYDGFTRPIPCDVSNYVFGHINRDQLSKVWCDIRADFNEVVWFYPIGSGNTECSRYVAYNYVLGCWSIGALDRTAGIDRGVFPYPYMAHSGGKVYKHEKGTTYTDDDSTKTLYAEGGPLERDLGDNVFMARQYVPDESTLGQVNTTLYTRMYPTGSETTNGPYTNANPTDVRFTARQVRVRHTQVTAGWRVGTPRLEVTPGGLR